MTTSSKLFNIVNEMDDLVAEMEEKFYQFEDLVKKADINGEEFGLDLTPLFNAYVGAQIKIAITQNHGYLTNDKGLHDIIDDVREAACEIREMEREEESVTCG